MIFASKIINRLIPCIFICIIIFKEVNCLRKRCFRCRSRGELGSCRDPFLYNVTTADQEPGVDVEECSSGWCGKIFEGNTDSFNSDDYGAATQKLCLQRPPSDYEERCANTVWSHRKVFMCFCKGDLCNSANTHTTSLLYLLGLSTLTMLWNIV